MYAFDAFSNDKDIAQSVRNAFVKKVRSGSSLAPLSLSRPHSIRIAHRFFAFPSRSTMACGTALSAATSART